jgi:hypothetical protein
VNERRHTVIDYARRRDDVGGVRPWPVWAFVLVLVAGVAGLRWVNCLMVVRQSPAVAPAPVRPTTDATR